MVVDTALLRVVPFIFVKLVLLDTTARVGVGPALAKFRAGMAGMAGMIRCPGGFGIGPKENKTGARQSVWRHCKWLLEPETSCGLPPGHIRTGSSSLPVPFPSPVGKKHVPPTVLWLGWGSGTHTIINSAPKKSCYKRSASDARVGRGPSAMPQHRPSICSGLRHLLQGMNGDDRF